MRGRLLLVLVLGAMGPAAAASAQQPPPAAPPPAAPTPPAPPAAGTLRLALEHVSGHVPTVLAGDRYRVRGTVTPYVAGQRAVVRVRRGARKLVVRRVAVRRSSTGRTGSFLLGLRAGRAGRLWVTASHAATTQQRTMVARPHTLDVLPRRVGPGSPRSAVRILQARLAAIGYVVGRRGAFDGRTARAVVAFRKVTGMARTAAASSPVLRRLARDGGHFKARFASNGRHVEADLSRQVLVLIDRGRVQRIYPTSSGKASTPTIRGQFRIYRKSFGTNALGMVHAAYFQGGYAIHGYHAVPVYNASHGCLRVPVPDALSIFRWVQRGTRVDVYG